MLASVTSVESNPNWSDTTRIRLDENIPRDVISKRDAGQGRTLDYLEGWYVIARLNEIFGQGNWSYTTEEMRLVFEGTINDKKVAHYVARVTVRALGTSFTDYGYGDGTDKYNPGKAHELAVKEAVTDGIKRAAKNFGMSMGLALYDKSREFVDEAESSTGTGNPKRTAGVKPTSVPRVDSSTPNAPAPSQGKDESHQAPMEGKIRESLSSKAKTREEVNTLISSASKVAIAKKLTDVTGLRAYMSTTWGSDVKEKLTDVQAREFLDHLDKMIHTEVK